MQQKICDICKKIIRTGYSNLNLGMFITYDCYYEKDSRGYQQRHYDLCLDCSKKVLKVLEE